MNIGVHVSFWILVFLGYMFSIGITGFSKLEHFYIIDVINICIFENLKWVSDSNLKTIVCLWEKSYYCILPNFWKPGILTNLGNLKINELCSNLKIRLYLSPRYPFLIPFSNKKKSGVFGDMADLRAGEVKYITWV